jgi:hypothetical protein
LAGGRARKNQNFAVSIGFDTGRFAQPAALDFSGGTAS